MNENLLQILGQPEPEIDEDPRLHTKSGSLSLHIKSTDGGLIKKAGIILCYDPGAQRMLDHRKVNHQNLAHRHASIEELNTENYVYRVHFLIYDNWDKLINDERKFTDDPKWFAKIDELRKRFPQFNVKEATVEQAQLPEQLEAFDASEYEMPDMEEEFA